MKILLISLLKMAMRILYVPIKLFKTQDRIVYLSRQSNEKSLDMLLLEKEISRLHPNVEQVFRLKMMDDGIVSKIKYGFYMIGDMYYLATSKVAVLDTYSITVSCLQHKKSLKVIQMWHALGALKKFGLQSLNKKDGRDGNVSRAMCMHKNYDYVMAPSQATAKFYMDAFGVEQSKIKICPLPRVDVITDGKAKTAEFFNLNPGVGAKKIVVYVPTFREREAYITQMLKTQFEDMEDYRLFISAHPLSKVRRDDKYLPNGCFSSMDLMKLADVIITDYSACAFEAALLMKPLYFFVPDYNEYNTERGVNVDIREEMPGAVFEQADELASAIIQGGYDMDLLYSFKDKYIQNNNSSNTEILAKFVLMQM